MRKILLATLVVLSTSACASVGRLELFPTIYVHVVNNCRDSVLLIKLPDGKEVALKYTGLETVKLQTASHLTGVNGFYPYQSFTLTVRGFGTDGAYLGSASQRFTFTGQGGRQADQDWHIGNLQDGERRCQP